MKLAGRNWQEREREERVEEVFIPPTQKRVITTLRPRISSKTPETPGSPKISGKPGNSDLRRSAPKKLTL
jgi:hypothetical protein